MIEAHINNTPCGLFDFVCKYLPEDYEIVFECEKGAGGVKLQGGVSTPHWPTFDDDDLDLVECTMMRVNWARKQNGLEEIINV